MMAAHGSRVKYRHEVVGMNSRLDAIHAVTLNAKLARLDAWNARRQAAADRYADLLRELPGVRVPRSLEGNNDVWHLYVVRVAERDRVLAELNDAGVGAALHYPDPWYLTPAYRHLGYAEGTAPVAEKAAKQILSLPMFPHLTDDQVLGVREGLSAVMAGRVRVAVG
jgi:dTDP-4-amino-4,6-dideoxygalactose transaminase